MGKKSSFLPKRVSGAIKSILKRVFGVAFIGIGIWALFALFFHNSYLDGFATASSFGSQSLMGQAIAILRYMVGFIPTLFLILCLIRFGIVWFVGWKEESPYLYNILRGFVALCFGSAGFGLIIPSSTFGGLFGAIVSNDLFSWLGNWSILVGLVFLMIFCLLAGFLLNIRWAHVVQLFRVIKNFFHWVLSAFHLTSAPQPIYEEEETVKKKIFPFHRKIKTPIIKKTVQHKEPTIRKKTSVSRKGFQLPKFSFLEKSSFGKAAITSELKRNAVALEVHFEEYGVRGKVTGIKPGPIVTLYEFLPEEGMRIADINKTVKDMTRAMAVENIRIAHIPNTQLIGVEMVNLDRQMVRAQGLLANPAFINSKYEIPLALGVDIGGSPMYFDLAKMPHVLIAGRTGSGKSVFVQSIIMSILYHFTPDKCKLMIVDLKGVDFTLWHDIPHLIAPILTHAAGAVNALKWSVREMDERYKKLQLLGVQNIEGYNEAVAKKREKGEIVTQKIAVGTNSETGEIEYETQKLDLSDMPYLVIIIDEVADLMILARKEVEACVQRLAQKARAAGIHLVMATQRPDISVITGVIKANFPTRISFQARSSVDSITTLGEKGAEQLLAYGDMLFSEAGRVPVRIHGMFIDNTEINKVADFLRAQGEPEFIEGIEQAQNSIMPMGAIPGIPSSKADKDSDLYEQAKEYVLRDKKPTISYIQRRLGIGYNKAAGFMERMENEGIVSAPDANNKRHIL